MNIEVKRFSPFPVHFFAALSLATAWGAIEQGGSESTGKKVLLVYDMEGLSGVTTSGTVTVDSQYYSAARESLADEVNAAVRGLREAGASEVVLTDGHGSGNPSPDYPIERLPAGARHEIREQPYDPYTAVNDGDYSAVVAIGMHSGSGSSGFGAHTMLPHTRWIANGFALNESMILAAFAGRSRVPLIMVTGDDVLRQEIQAFSPKTRFVTVKQAVSGGSAQARPKEEVLERIESAAAEALGGLQEIPPWRKLQDGSIRNEFGYRTRAQTQLASLFPHVEVLNEKTVVLRTDDFEEGYLTFRALAQYTFLAHMSWVVETIYELDDSEEILRRIGERFPREGNSFEATERELDSNMFATHGSK